MVRSIVTLTALALFVLPGGLAAQQESADDPPVVEVTAVDYAFQAPDSIPSGWVTFRLTNEGKETHYFSLAQLPDGTTYRDFREEFLAPLDSVRRRLHVGTMDTATADSVLDRILPDWYGRPAYAGGVGMIGPRRTSQATLQLAPGTYVMSCFLAARNGRYHAVLGMVRPLVVTEVSSGGSPPDPDVKLTSSGHEIVSEGAYQAGRQTVALTVEKPPRGMDVPYETGHLARLGPETQVDEVASWHENRFRAPAPAEFVGGFEHVPTGQTVYTTVELKPGRYAWFFYPYYGQGETLVTEFTVE